MKLKLTFLLVTLLSVCTVTIGQTIINDFYQVRAGQGNGIKFYGNKEFYKIHMGSTENNKYGPVTGFSIKTNMKDNAGWGWTWGPYNGKPIAGLNILGNFQMKGWLKTDTGVLYLKNSQRLQGDGGSAFYLNSAHANTTQLIMRDRDNTIYGRVYGNSNGSQFGLRDGDNHWSFLAVKDSYTSFKINNSEKMRIMAGGNVGIGTTAPLAKLEVKGAVWATSHGTRSNRVEIGHGGINGYVNMMGAGNFDLRHMGSTVMSMRANGNVVIGSVSTPSSDYKLYVEKGILAEKVRVAVKNSSDWADYVFEEDYSNLPIQEVRDYIQENNHLPNVPSAEEVVKSGIDVAKMDAILLRKLEEAYLHIIDLDERLNELQTKLEALNK